MAAQQQERLEVPAGGIADFAKTDEEIAALEAEAARQDFGEAGIANFSDIAGPLADYGRFGDDSVAHVKSGEIIVPKELIENNPRLRDQIFAELMEAGIEDPEQYVVGSSANRINPETGLMEFGFFSKLWKKLKKVVKKVIGVVLPIVLAMVPVFGPILGAALGSGIATLVQGGDLKDAFKSAALSGLSAGVFKGVTGKGTFMENVRGALPGGTPPTGVPIADAATPTSEFIGDQVAEVTRGTGIADVLRGDLAAGSTTTDLSSLTPGGVDVPIDLSGAADLTVGGGSTRPFYRSGPIPGQNVLEPSTATMVDNYRAMAAADPSTLLPTDPIKDPSIWDKTKNWLSGRDADVTAADADAARMKEAVDAGNAAERNYWAGGGEDPIQARDVKRQAFNQVNSAPPSLLKQYSRPLMVGTGLLAATGGFNTPEGEDPDVLGRDADGNLITGSTLLAKNPGKYMVKQLGRFQFNTATGEYEDTWAKEEEEESNSILASSLMRDNPYLQLPQYSNPPVNVARGGAMYPRRTGGVMPHEGTPNEDSVRALLMPGEFVMTTDAVRGAGNGNLNTGINNMYGVMRNLERRGRVA